AFYCLGNEGLQSLFHNRTAARIDHLHFRGVGFHRDDLVTHFGETPRAYTAHIPNSKYANSHTTWSRVIYSTHSLKPENILSIEASRIMSSRELREKSALTLSLSSKYMIRSFRDVKSLRGTMKPFLPGLR